MCVIIYLPKGHEIPKTAFANAVYNNEDGFGIVYSDSPEWKNIKMRREFDKADDPDFLFQIVSDLKDKERFIHLRNATEGEVNEENLHPFVVNVSGNRSVYFMHNGTLNHFKAGVQDSDEEKKKSDTYRFFKTFLEPTLLCMRGDRGNGDFHNPMFKRFLWQHWTNSIGGYSSSSISRGVLIGTGLEPLFINDAGWVEVDFDGKKVKASNNQYFSSVIRGKEFERRKAEEAKKKPATFQNSNIVPLKDINLNTPNRVDLNDVFNDVDFWSEDGYASLAAVTSEEWEDFVKNSPAMVVPLLETITMEYHHLNEIYRKALLKKERGEKVIEQLQLELGEKRVG